MLNRIIVLHMYAMERFNFDENGINAEIIVSDSHVNSLGATERFREKEREKAVERVRKS